MNRKKIPLLAGAMTVAVVGVALALSIMLKPTIADQRETITTDQWTAPEDSTYQFMLEPDYYQTEIASGEGEVWEVIGQYSSDVSQILVNFEYGSLRFNEEYIVPDSIKHSTEKNSHLFEFLEEGRFVIYLGIHLALPPQKEDEIIDLLIQKSGDYGLSFKEIKPPYVRVEHELGISLAFLRIVDISAGDIIKLQILTNRIGQGTRFVEAASGAGWATPATPSQILTIMKIEIPQ